MSHPETSSTETALLERMERLEEKLDRLTQLIVDQRTIKEWYTIDEAAKILGKAPFTVREWCRWGRIHAHKRETRVGRNATWGITHEELERIRNHGLLPIPKGPGSQTLPLSG